MLLLKLARKYRILFATIIILLHFSAEIKASNEVKVFPRDKSRKTTDTDDLLLTCEYPANASSAVWENPFGDVIQEAEKVNSNSETRKLTKIVKSSKILNGKYACKVEINGDEIRETAKITLIKTLHFIDAPKEQFFRQNTTAQIKCIVTGNPMPEDVNWKKGATPITTNSSGRVYVNNTQYSILVVKHIQPEDEGDYTCEATHTQTAQVNSETIAVAVQYPPSYATVSKPDAVIERGNLSLNCSADGKPTPSYKWYLNNVEIEKGLENNRTILRLVNVSAQDAGNYTCSASNDYGTKNDTAFVQVHVPPQIQFDDFGPVNESKIVSWRCRVESAPESTIEIYKDNKKLESRNATDTDSRTVEGNGTVVTIRFEGVRSDDAGTYECRANNTVDRRFKRAKLEVLFAPQWDTSLSTNVQGCIDNEAVLSCKFIGNPHPTIRWMRKQMPEQTTQLAAVTSNATNTSIASSEANIASVPLSTEPGPEEVRTFETMAPEGFVLLESNDMYNITAGSGASQLQIKKITTESYGNYYCKGSNMFNSSIQSINLRETALPSSVAFDIVESSIGTNRVGIRTPTTRDNEVVDKYILRLHLNETEVNTKKATSNAIVYFDGLNHNTSYSVTVFARNCKGKGSPITRTFSTDLISKPQPMNITSNKASKFSTNYTLTWIAGNAGGGSFQKIIISLWPTAQNQTRTNITIMSRDKEFLNNAYTFTDLQPGSNYGVIIEVFNEVGSERAEFQFSTESEASTIENSSVPLIKGGLNSTLIIIIIVASLVFLIVIDIILCTTKNCGLLHCIYVSTCGGSSEKNSGKENVEEGSAIYRKKPETSRQKSEDRVLIVQSEKQPLAKDAEPISNGTEQEAGVVNEKTPLSVDQSNPRSDEAQKQAPPEGTHKTSSPVAPADDSD